MNAYLKDQSDVDEKDYDEWLDSIYGEVTIANCTFDASRILKELDETVYECGKSDYIEGLDDIWVCDECGEEYESEYDAEECCKEEEEESEDDDDGE